MGRQAGQGFLARMCRMFRAQPRNFHGRSAIAAAGMALLLCRGGVSMAQVAQVTPTPAVASQVTELIRQGDLEDARSNTKGALALFLEADKSSPDSPAILVRISKEYIDLAGEANPAGEAQKAAKNSMDYAKRAVDLDPKCAKAHLSLAIGYGRMTDFTDNKTKVVYSKYVKEETEKSIALDPTDAFAYHVLGRWNYSVANLNPMLKLLAKFVYGGLPEASMEDAARYLKKATELAPQRIIHHFELARTYKAMGKNDLAGREWEAILALHAGNKEDESAQKEAREELKGRMSYEGPAANGLMASNSQPARKQSPPAGGGMIPAQRASEAANK